MNNVSQLLLAGGSWMQLSVFWNHPPEEQHLQTYHHIATMWVKQQTTSQFYHQWVVSTIKIWVVYDCFTHSRCFVQSNLDVHGFTIDLLHQTIDSKIIWRKKTNIFADLSIATLVYQRVNHPPIGIPPWKHMEATVLSKSFPIFRRPKRRPRPRASRPASKCLVFSRSWFSSSRDLAIGETKHHIWHIRYQLKQLNISYIFIRFYYVI